MDNLELLRKHMEALTKGDWKAYKAGFTDNAVYDEEATRRVARGPDEIVKAVQPWKIGFPDLRSTLKNTVATGDAVVAEVEWEGTHNGVLQGPMGSLPPTGRHGKVAAVLVVRFENGKIREMRHYFDLMTILAQLGVAPQPGAPARP